MTIDYTKQNEIIIITIVGDIDASSAIELDNKLAMVGNEKVSGLLVDCEGLEYISSAGLGVFMSYIKDFKDLDIKMVLFGLDRKVKKVFELIGLHNLLNIQETRELALKEIV